MAFRRRFSRGLRMRRRKKEYAWITTLFNETSLTMAGAPDINELILLDPDSDLNAIPASINKLWHVRRVVLRGVFMPIPSNLSTGHDAMAWKVMMYTIDREDTDASITTSPAGSIINTERVLYADQIGYVSRATTLAAGSWTPALYDCPRLDIDSNLNVTLRGDRLLVCGIQAENTTTVVALQPFSCVSRVLVDFGTR